MITKENFTKKNILSFFRAYDRILQHTIGTKDIPEHELAQVVMRALLCKDCTDNGACKYCNCKTPDQYFDPLRSDSAGKWGPMMSKDEWEAFESNLQSIMLQLYSNYYRDNYFSRSTNVEGALKLKVDTTSHDLGNVKYDSRHVVTFNITNDTDKDVIIRNISTSCSCTLADVDDMIIKPNSVLPIKVNYHANKKGNNTKVISVHFVDKSVSSINLFIKSNVE